MMFVLIVLREPPRRMALAEILIRTAGHRLQGCAAGWGSRNYPLAEGMASEGCMVVFVGHRARCLAAAETAVLAAVAVAVIPRFRTCSIDFPE